MEVTHRTAAGLRWVVREGSDDRRGPDHEMTLDAIVGVPRGGVFLDVGAHVGHFALRAARDAQLVVAFEPGPYQRAGLEANLAMNGLTNVRVVPKAAWDAPRMLAFEPGPDGEYARSVVREAEDGTVEATTLDAEAARLARVDLIKVDVQGAEARVLEGARRTLARHKPRVVVEMHDRELGDPSIRAGVTRVLGELGYAWTEVHSDDRNDHLYGVPAEEERALDELLARVAARRRWESIVLAPGRVWDGVQRRLRAGRRA